MMTTIPRAGKTRFLLATIMSLLVVSAFAFKVEKRIEKMYPAALAPVISLPKDTVKKVRNEAMLAPEKNATFNGKGLEAFNEYVAQNIKYPSEAVKSNMQGKVYVQFLVDTDGKVSDAKVLRGISPTLDNEAIRVVKSSPVWSPAIDKGARVKQLFTLPIIFKLQK
jgi:protein TonB